MSNRHWQTGMRRVGRSDDGTAFFPDPGEGPARAPDALAEELAEDFLTSALTGQEQAPESHDRVVEEEDGGPFIVSSYRREFAKGDRSDDDYEPEAFPMANHEGVIPPSESGEEEEEEEE